MRRLLVWVCLAQAFGCSDDTSEGADAMPQGDGSTADAGVSTGGPAERFEGHWSFVSLTKVEAGGGTNALTTSSSPESIAGYTHFSAMGGSGLRVQILLETLTNGVPTQVSSLEVVTATVDETHYLLDMPAGTFAYAYELGSDQITFTRDRSHASDNQPAEGAPAEMVLIRADPPRGLVGTWHASAFVSGDGTSVDRGACVTDTAGSAKFALDITVQESFLTELQLTAEYFTDSACMTAAGTETDMVAGFMLTKTGAASLYAVAKSDPTSSGQRVDFDVTPATGGFLLTRTDCLPKPLCLTDAPQSITLMP